MGKELYTLSLTRIYDEVGNAEYGWYALLIYKGKPYIIEVRDKVLSYTQYPSRASVRKAWDHVVNKFEKWFTNEEEEYERSNLECTE